MKKNNILLKIFLSCFRFSVWPYSDLITFIFTLLFAVGSAD